MRTFSGGMKRRLNLVCGMVHEPKLLLLDEPTVGVDPQSRERIFEAVERIAGEGTTVVYTTHYMEEAERLCDRERVVVLPAPFGPSSPKISPGSMSRLKLLTASISPKRLVSPSIRMPSFDAARTRPWYDKVDADRATGERGSELHRVRRPTGARHPNSACHLG